MGVTRRGLLAAFGLAVSACGCSSDLGSIVYFLTPERLDPPETKKLASDDKNRRTPVKVVVLPYVSLDIAQTEFLNADGQLADLMARQLTTLAAEDNEKLTVVPWSKVKEYLSRHPDWRLNLEPQQIGEDLHADYVIEVDVRKLSLYEPGSYNRVYAGRAEVVLSLVDVRRRDEPAEQRELNFVYPSEATRGSDVADADTPPYVFKARFFNYMTKHLAWHFVPHHKAENGVVE